MCDWNRIINRVEPVKKTKINHMSYVKKHTTGGSGRAFGLLQ